MTSPTCLELAKEENMKLFNQLNDEEVESATLYQKCIDYENIIHSRRLWVFYTLIATAIVSFVLGVMFVWVRMGMPRHITYCQGDYVNTDMIQACYY